MATVSNEWLSAVLPLGVLAEDTWKPSGAGVLFLEQDAVWLLTSRSALQREEGQHLAATVGQGAQATLLDVTAAQEASGLDWIEHERLDLAASMFPVDPSWGIKAFNSQSCLLSRDHGPLLTCLTVGFPYALPRPAGGLPPRLVLDGVVSGLEPDLLYATAPLAPSCSGAPLLVLTAPPTLGGAVLLAGIATHDQPLRQEDRLIPSALTAPNLRVTVAHPIDEALALIRGEQAQAQRQRLQA